MKQTYVYRKSKLFGRFGAICLDLLIGFILFIVAMLCIVIPIFNGCSSYPNVNKEYEDKMISFHIYEVDESGVGYIKDDYDNKLTYFFDEFDDIETYNDLKANSDVFSYDAVNNIYIPVGDASKMNDFYRSALKIANEIVWQREDVKKIGNQLETYNKLIVYISVIISSAVTFLVPALIFNDRATIGMKPFHFQIVSKKSGDSATRLQIMFRYLIFLAFEIIPTYFYVGYAIILISILMIFFTKEKLSLSDFLCSTVVADKMGYNNQTPEKELIFIEVEKSELKEQENGKGE